MYFIRVHKLINECFVVLFLIFTSFSFYATEAGKYKRLCSSKGFRNDCKNNFLPCRRGCLRIFGMGL